MRYRPKGVVPSLLASSMLGSTPRPHETILIPKKRPFPWLSLLDISCANHSTFGHLTASLSDGVIHLGKQCPGVVSHFLHIEDLHSEGPATFRACFGVGFSAHIRSFAQPASFHVAPLLKPASRWRHSPCLFPRTTPLCACSQLWSRGLLHRLPSVSPQVSQP